MKRAKYFSYTNVPPANAKHTGPDLRERDPFYAKYNLPCLIVTLRERDSFFANAKGKSQQPSTSSTGMREFLREHVEENQTPANLMLQSLPKSKFQSVNYPKSTRGPRDLNQLYQHVPKYITNIVEPSNYIKQR